MFTEEERKLLMWSLRSSLNSMARAAGKNPIMQKAYAEQVERLHSLMRKVEELK